MAKAHGDRGAATLGAALACALLVAGSIVIAQASRALSLASRTQAAADLSALAAANALLSFAPDPCGSARIIAARNGAALRSCQLSQPDTGAEVRVAVVAQRAVRPLSAPGSHARAGLRVIDGE